MTDIRRTPELHRLLDSVAEENVLHFNGLCGAHPEGWGWIGMAHMPMGMEFDLRLLLHKGLITFTKPPDPCGNKVLLTFEGSSRLSDWNVLWPKGDVA